MTDHVIRLNENAAAFAFTEMDVDGNLTTRTFGPGDHYVNRDICEFVRFMKAYEDAQNSAGRDSGYTESEVGLAEKYYKEAEEAGCIGVDYANILFFGSINPPNESKQDGDDSAKKQGQYVDPNATVGGSGEGKAKEGEGGGTSDHDEEETRPQKGEGHKSHGRERSQTQTGSADPVDVFTGVFYLQEKDLEIPNTIIPLSFVRTYRSGDGTFGPLGWNWDHNYNMYIRILNDGSVAVWRNLHEDKFVFNGTAFEGPPGIFEKLDRITGFYDAFEISTGGGNTLHFERPPGWQDAERIPITWIRDRNGNLISFSYGQADRLEEVKDDDNRFLKFEYDSCGLIISVSDDANRKYTYEHNEESLHLTKVVSPCTSDFPKGITKIYNYENPFSSPKLRHNIISIVDSNGNVYVENKYEQDPAVWSFGRIIEQLYGGFLYQIRYTQIQWVPAKNLFINTPYLLVELMNPDFGLETFTFNYRGDLMDHRYRLNKDNSFRVIIWQYEYDDQGNLAVTTRPDGSQEICIYDFNNSDPRMRGKLLQKEITSAAGSPSPSRIIWKGRYNNDYQLLVEEENELGSKTRYKYDFDLTPGAVSNSGKLMEMIKPNATLPDGSVQISITKYEYNIKGQIIAIILPNGVRNETIYGTVGSEKSRSIKKILDKWGLNVVNDVKYDLQGHIMESIDNNGNSTAYSTNALGLIEKVFLPPIDATRTEYRYHYDENRKLISYERPVGEYTDPVLSGSHIIDTIERDVLGYVTKSSLSNNTSEVRTIRLCSDYRGMPVDTYYPDGSQIKRVYDERGLLIHETKMGQNNEELPINKVYDRMGNLIQETDSFGQTTNYEYDGFSRRIKTKVQNETEIIQKWGKGDLPESLEFVGYDGFGNFRQLEKIVYEYDELGRKIAETSKSFKEIPSISVDVTVKYFFDTLGNIERIVDNRGGVTSFEFDGLNRIRVKTDPLGNEELFTYDNNGNVIVLIRRHKEPDGLTSIVQKKFAFDARNRRIETIQPDGSKFIEIYDDRDIVTHTIDYSGIVKEYKYNSFNDCTSIVHDVDNSNIHHQWVFDQMSRVTSYVDPTGEISRYYYDDLGRISKIEFSNGYSCTKKYNTYGQLTEEILGSGVKFEYKYDKANRLSILKNTQWPTSIHPILPHTFEYDGLNRLVSATVGGNSVVRKYDSRGRLILEKSHEMILGATYQDNLGFVEKVWSDGRTERLYYDLNNIIAKIEQVQNSQLGSNLSTIVSFKPSGKDYFGEVTYSGDFKLNNLYDERKRIIQIGIRSPFVDTMIKYRYDSANRRKIETNLEQSNIRYYEFDNQYRLSFAKSGFTSTVSDGVEQEEQDQAINEVRSASASAHDIEQFIYDDSDARLKFISNGNLIKDYTYLPGHRIKNDGTNSFAYHHDGTIENDGHQSFEIDALGRIINIKRGNIEICKITYDALNRPSIVEQLGLPIKSLNYFGQTVEQENEDGVPARQITLDSNSGIPIAYHSNLGTHYTVFDARYNLIALANTNGELVETFEYGSFGIPIIKNSSGMILMTSNYGADPIFGGLRFLSSTQLYLSLRRIMDPTNGVFLSQDVKGFIDSGSLYTYSQQNPISNLDLLGEQVEHEESPNVLKHTQEHLSHAPHLLNAAIKTTIEFFDHVARHGIANALSSVLMSADTSGIVFEAETTAWLKNIYRSPVDTAKRAWVDIETENAWNARGSMGSSLIGSAAGVLTIFSGMINFYRAATEIDNTPLKMGLMAASFVQTLSGNAIMMGYLEKDLAMLKIGDIGGRWTGGLAASVFSAYNLGSRIHKKGLWDALWDFQTITDGLGIASGILLIAGSQLAAWFAAAYLASYFIRSIYEGFKDLAISVIQLFLGIEGTLLGQGATAFDNEHVKK